MKRNTLEHPKVLELADALDLPRYAAVGVLESMWVWAGRYCPRGDIGRYSDRRIAFGAIGWEGDGGKLIEALIATGWLDRDDEHRLLIHDWADHADDATRKALEKEGTTFATGEPPRKYRTRGSGTPEERTNRDLGAIHSRMDRESGATESRLPEPEPCPSLSPSLSQGEESAASAPPPAKTKARKARSRGTPFPDPFPHDVLQKLYDWGRENGITPDDVRRGVVDARDWALANPSKAIKADWFAFMRTWLRREKRDGRTSGPRGSGPQGSGKDVLAATARIAARRGVAGFSS